MYTIATQPQTTLEETLAYRHAGCIGRYRKEHDATPEEAEEVFQEMLKFLFLSYRAATIESLGFGCAISAEIEKIDWMWHTFLLFTMDYADFCEDHFGFFLHHVPNEAEDESPLTDDDNALRAQVEQQFALVYDVLGEETLKAWYEQCRYAATA